MSYLLMYYILIILVSWVGHHQVCLIDLNKVI